MKRNCFFMVQMALWVTVLGFASPADAVAVGENLTNLSIKHVEHGSLDGEGLKGKITLINFWATWCEACKVEIGEMEQQLKSLAEDSKVQVAFVNLDKDPNVAKNWFSSNLKYPEFWLKSAPRPKGL